MKKHLVIIILSLVVGFGMAQPATAAPDGKWFEKAMEGNRIAQRHIAEGFEYGINGFPKSLVFARRWYAIAAANGDKSATASVERIDAKIKNATLVFARSDSAVNKANFREIRSKLTDSDAFSAEFETDLFNDDLDGYLLIGSVSSGSIDGAYLPRYANSDRSKDSPDLPIRRD
ncbi:MAG: hypothetical protein AAF996_06355 [Pseudomonadota bacterium]